MNMASTLTFSRKRRLLLAAKSNAWAVAIAILFAGNFVIGRPEGYIFPVSQNYQILSVTLQKDGYLRYDVTFDKVRNCDAVAGRLVYKAKGYYIEAKWKPDSHYYIVSRLVGHQRATWQLSVPPDYFNAPLIIIGYHKCFGPLFWTTKTQQEVTYSGKLYYDTEATDTDAGQPSSEDQSPQYQQPSQPMRGDTPDSSPRSGESVQGG